MAPKKPPPVPPPPEIIRRLHEEWPTIVLSLINYAYKKCRHLERAEDLVGDCYLSLLTGERKWDTENDPILKLVAGSAINSMLSNQRRSARSRLDGGDDGDLEDAAPSSRNPERLNIEKEEHDHWKTVSERFAAQAQPGDKAIEYLALVQRGVGAVAEQAERLGLTVDQVKYLQKRVRAMLVELAKEVA
jgi:DNA-directed RNA polymerase specialized sigma24 family protein